MGLTTGGVLLTGGGSSRMGRDKALLTVDGVTLADRAARALRAVCEDVVEAGPGYSGLPIVREDPPGSGPAAALVAASDALQSEMVLLLAVDMPNVSVALLELLRDHPSTGSVVPEAEERLQVACCRYSAAAVSSAREVCTSRAGVPAPSVVPGLHDVLRSAPYLVLGAAEWGSVAEPSAFADLDTPEDLRRHGLSGRR